MYEEKFLSTLPARGATDLLLHGGPGRGISIHAPREGSDAQYWGVPQRRRNFYPRSPRGERLPRLDQAGQPTEFLSTLPARGATRTAVYNTTAELFLSTLPARGATMTLCIS